jgi:general secretion pathway protein L
LRLSEAPDKQDQQVTMTGFSAAGSSLVALVDRSPLFFDASLTAPIALDSVEQRERFALQAKLKRRDPIKAAAR